jgi:propanol-preferring alcohol dehydrogenase
MTATTERTVPRTARSAVWQANNRLEVQDLPVPEPGPGQVLVRVRACGICGSELHRFHTNVPRPAVPGIGPGHEVAGEVAALGPGVDGPAVGTRVAPLAGDVCGGCSMCRAGRYALCPRAKIAGVSWPGGIAE